MGFGKNFDAVFHNGRDVCVAGAKRHGYRFVRTGCRDADEEHVGFVGLVNVHGFRCPAANFASLGIRDARQNFQGLLGRSHDETRGDRCFDPVQAARVGNDDALDVFHDVARDFYVNYVRVPAQAVARDGGSIRESNRFGAAHGGHQFARERRAVNFKVGSHGKRNAFKGKRERSRKKSRDLTQNVAVWPDRKSRAGFTLSDDFEAFEYVRREPHDSVANGASQGFEKRFARPGTSAQGFDGRHYVGSNADLQDGRH